MDRALTLTQRRNNQIGIDLALIYSLRVWSSLTKSRTLYVCVCSLLFTFYTFSCCLPSDSTSYIYLADIVFVSVLFVMFWKEAVFSKTPSLQNSTRLAVVCVSVFEVREWQKRVHLWFEQRQTSSVSPFCELGRVDEDLMIAEGKLGCYNSWNKETDKKRIWKKKCWR